MWWRKSGLWLLLALGAFLRLFRLGRESLWWDEGWQYHVATAGSPREFLDRFLDPSVTSHPPLSHAVSYLFLLFGRTDVMLRLPAALFGIGSLVLVHRLARRLFSERVALVAMLVMAIAPFHVHYSQEGRMYSQLMFLALASTLLLLRAVERPTAGRWVLYGVSITAAIYTHVYASLGILAQALWVLATHRGRLRAFVAAGAAAVVCFVPMVAFFLRRVAGQRVPYGGAGSSPGDLPYTLFVYGVGFTLGPSTRELREDRSLDTLLPHLPLFLVVALLFGVLALIGLWVTTRTERGTIQSLAALSLLIPVLGVAAVTLSPKITFNVRYTAWAFPFFCIAIGAGIDRLAGKWRLATTAVMAAIVVLSAVSLLNFYTNPRYAKEDVRDAVAYWRENAGGLPLLSYNGFPTVDRYLAPEEASLHYPIWRRSHAVERTLAVMEETGTANGIYVILCRDWHAIVETALVQSFLMEDAMEFPGGVRILKVRRPPDAGFPPRTSG